MARTPMMKELCRALARMFTPARTDMAAPDVHALCVTARTHESLQDRMREMEAQLQTHRMQVLATEQRLEAAEARSMYYGKRLAALQKAAFPVSFLLTEGGCEEAMAINSRLWDLVREDDEQA